MIREIKTNIGMFGSYKDMYKFMLEEKIEEIEIEFIRLWNNDYLKAGKFTIDEIEKINDIKEC